MSDHHEGGDHGHGEKMTRREFFDVLTFKVYGVLKGMTSIKGLFEGGVKLASIFSDFISAPVKRSGGGGGHSGGGHDHGGGHGHH